MKRSHFNEISNTPVLIELIVLFIVVVLAAALSASFFRTGPGHRHGIVRPLAKVMNAQFVHKDPVNTAVDRTSTLSVPAMELQNRGSHVAPSGHESQQQGEKDRTPKENRSYDQIYWDQLATA